MEINYNSCCCGLKELNGLSWHDESKTAMFALCKILYPTVAENEAKLNEARRRAVNAGYQHVENAPVLGYWGNSVRNGAFHDNLQYAKFRFATFSEAIPPGRDEAAAQLTYGRRFAAFIQENDLGSLVETPREVNPNSGSSLKVWVWGINHENLTKWYAKQQGKSVKSVAATVVAAANTVLGRF